MCVNATSPLTFNIVGFTKACVQSVGGVVVLGDKLSAQSGAGILLTLVASIWYSFIKLQEQQPAAQTPPKVFDEDKLDELEMGEKSQLLESNMPPASSLSRSVKPTSAVGPGESCMMEENEEGHAEAVTRKLNKKMVSFDEESSESEKKSGESPSSKKGLMGLLFG